MTLLLSDAIMKKIKCDYVNITQKKKKKIRLILPSYLTLLVSNVALLLSKIIILLSNMILLSYVKLLLSNVTLLSNVYI